ncbi:MAG: hypothetical protein WAO71_00865 [Gallionella sp.]
MLDSSAKKIVLSIITAILVLSVLSWFPSPEPKDIGRLCINGALCWFLFKGKNWARWIFVVLLALGGAIAVFAITTGPSGTEKSIILLVMSVTYLASAGLLVFSKSVASYFSAPIQINS